MGVPRVGIAGGSRMGARGMVAVRARRGRAESARTVRVTPRLSGREHELVSAAAAAAGMAVDAWAGDVLVSAAAGQVRPLPAGAGQVARQMLDLRGELRRVGVLLNQVARAVNAGGLVGAEHAGRVLAQADQVVDRLDRLTGLLARRLAR